MGSRRRTAIRLALLVLVLALLAGVAVVIGRPAAGPPSASPTASPSPTVEFVALGDSFAAGQGGGGYADECLRSDAGYPALLDDSTGIRLVANGSCTGATTGDVRETQLDALTPKADLVTITVGGNDLDAVGVAITCAAAPSSPECAAALRAALSVIESGELADRLTSTYTDIAAESPDAALVVTGYPFLFDTPPADDPSFPVVSALNSATSALNDTIRAAVVEAGRTGRATCFVDVTAAFAGHGIGSADPFVLAEGPDAFHPNEAGYRAYAEAIRSELPCSTRG